MIFSTGEKYKGDWSENKPSTFPLFILFYFLDEN